MKGLGQLVATRGAIEIYENGRRFVTTATPVPEFDRVPVMMLPERYEDRYPLMPPLPRRVRAEWDRRMLDGYEESEAIAVRVEAAKRALLNRGRLTIEELPLLFPGDQIFVRREITGPIKEWFVALLIRVVTFTRRDKRPTIVNHVATVVRAVVEFEAEVRADANGGRVPAMSEEMRLSARIVDYEIAEALGKGGFQYRRLLEVYGDPRSYSFAIARHKLATPRHRDKIVAACESLLGRKYGYLKLAAHVLDYGLTSFWNLAGGRGDVLAFRWLCRSERYPMCSWASLYIYRKAGLPFSTPLETGSPDDLWDECRRKAIEIWVWPFYSPKLRVELLGWGFGGTREGRAR